MDAERIRRQMQEVAVGNYRAFIAADDALSACREQLVAVGQHLDSMVPFLAPRLFSILLYLIEFFRYFFPISPLRPEQACE